MEPFLAVSGRLQIDGATINIIAHEVEALRVPGTLVQRRGLSRTLATEKLARTSPGTPPPASTTLPPGRPALIPAGATATHENVAYDASDPDGRPEGPEGPAHGALGLGSPDLAHLHTSLPEPLEYWDDKDEPRASPYQYLNALRQRPPGIKNFG